MAMRANFEGLDNIMSAFDNQENSYFSLWIGKAILLQNSNEDIQKGRDLLEATLTAAEQNGNNDVFTIKFHPGAGKDPYITDKTPVIASMFVRVVPLGGGNMGAVSVDGDRIPFAAYKLMEKLSVLPDILTEKLTAMDARITAMEADSMGDPEPEVDMLTRVLGLASNPVVMGLLTKILPNLFPQQPVQSMQVAGVETQPAPSVQITQAEADKLNIAIARLVPHTNIADDLSRLADLAEQNPAMFQMLLTQLRSQ